MGEAIGAHRQARHRARPLLEPKPHVAGVQSMAAGPEVDCFRTTPFWLSGRAEVWCGILASVTSSDAISYDWRGLFRDDELAELHERGFDRSLEHRHSGHQLHAHSLGWVTARDDGRLVGFVNVAWDGSAHAFLVDTVVTPECRRRGIGTELVRRAAHGARSAGCAWLHVDFEETLRPFYVGSSGFRTTPAGLMAL